MTNVLLYHALMYNGRGLSVIPCVPRDKKPDLPSWTLFQNQRASRDTIEHWWMDKPDRNIGLVTGEISGGLVALDFDAVEAFRAYCGQFPLLLDTRIHLSGSRKGYHAFYFVSILPASSKYETKFGRIEVKANGVQVVAPPSIHPSGNKYCVYHKPKAKHVHDLAEVVDWLKSNEKVKRDVFLLPLRPTDIPPNLSRATVDLLTNGCAEGERNMRLFKAACDFAGNGISQSEAESQLGGATGLPQREAFRTIASAYQKQRVPARPAQMVSTRNRLVDRFGKRMGSL